MSEVETYTFRLPSGATVELREMTGVEESLLTNKRLMRTGEAINKVLRNCITQIGNATADVSEKDVLDMLSGDRLFCMVKIRQISLGSEVVVSMPCSDSDCGADNDAHVNLDDLEVIPYPSIEQSFSFALPRSGKVVEFRLQNGHMEQRLASMNDADIHAAMLMRICAISEPDAPKGEKGQAPTKNTLRALSIADLNALRDEMRRVDGGIDTTITGACRVCGTRLATRLEVEPGFFFPSSVR